MCKCSAKVFFFLCKFFLQLCKVVNFSRQVCVNEKSSWYNVCIIFCYFRLKLSSTGMNIPKSYEVIAKLELRNRQTDEQTKTHARIDATSPQHFHSANSHNRVEHEMPTPIAERKREHGGEVSLERKRMGSHTFFFNVFYKFI